MNGVHTSYMSLDGIIALNLTFQKQIIVVMPCKTATVIKRDSTSKEQHLVLQPFTYLTDAVGVRAFF